MLLDKAEKGYRIYQIENVRDAEDVFSPNPEQKQLFYFDDFLGANYLEIVNADKTETQLTNFIDRIRHSENKYLILTTRTVILNYANEKYEKISRASLKRDKFEIELTDYNDYQKALILYNHLYFNQISNDLYEIIIQERFYWNIIKHKNYTPRLIEFLVEKREIENLTPVEYKELIINKLDNPKDIWKHSFENQISDLDRFLLFTLFTLGISTEISVLRKSYENRLNFEKKENNLSISSNAFENSIKILQDGFIVSKIYDRYSDKQYFDFINPSLTDFLIPYIEQSYSTKKDIISSVLYIEQFRRFSTNSKVFELNKELQEIIFDKITAKDMQTVYKSSKYSFCIEKLNALTNYCKDIDVDNEYLIILKEIDFNKIDKEIILVMFNARKLKNSFSYIKNNFTKIVKILSYRVNVLDKAKQLIELFDIYEYDYEEYSENEGYNDILKMIGNIVGKEEERVKEEWESKILDFEDIEYEYQELENMLDKLQEEFFNHENLYLSSDYDIYIDEEYWLELIKYNKENKKENHIEKTLYYSDDNEEKDSRAVDDLFKK